MFRIQMDHLPDWHWPPTAAGAGFGQVCVVLFVVVFIIIIEIIFRE